MPITILEKDLTVIAPEDLSNNIVYVPGFAVMGPANTPTLCRTIKEFQETFGTRPYVFEEQQLLDKEGLDSGYTTSSVEIETFAYSGSFEKSYIYAYELLKRGMPVLYERVMDTSGWYAKKDLVITNTLPESTTGTLTIQAKNPGRFGTFINIEIKKVSQDYKMLITLDYASDDAVKFGIPKKNVNEEIDFSLDINSTNYLGRLESNLVEFKIASNTNGTIEALSKSKLELSKQSTDREFSIKNLYANMKKNLFSKLEDKTEYDLKYITAGSYPIVGYEGIVTNILTAAGKRCDVIALLDTIESNMSYLDLKAVVQKIKEVPIERLNEKEDARKYGAIIPCWAVYETSFENQILAGSFAYLSCIASNVKSNENWYPIAGVTRGYVKNLKQLTKSMTGAIAETILSDTGISMNPIMNIKPYGYCIWGDRTLNNNIVDVSASSFLSIRAITNDVKKVVFNAARKLTFELNDDILWVKFKSEIEPFLDRLVSNNALRDYMVVKQKTEKRATVVAKIILYAIEPVEKWDITIELADNKVVVE